ncbi:hypothetical protein MMC11_007439 [Xylographa trunciseda]|nr:hypothetical protein [Xylographa trunciseda]
MDAYPEAKIILTNRDVDAWYRSCEGTLLQARTYWVHGMLQYFDWVTGLVHPLRRKYWRCLFADDFKTNGKAAMRAHYAEMREAAKKRGREVLEYGLGDGWGPLCSFLEVEVPKHAYPRENEGGDWIRKMRERARLRGKAAVYKFLRFGLPLALFGCGIWCIRPMFSTTFDGLP